MGPNRGSAPSRSTSSPGTRTVWAGFFRARRFRSLRPGETAFELAALALPPTTGNRFLLAKIPIGGTADHFYTVEARVRAGYDRHLPADAVVIHEVDLRPLRDGRHSQVILRWQSSPDGGPEASDFFDAQHGITVAVERQTEDTFRVDVRVTAGA